MYVKHVPGGFLRINNLVKYWLAYVSDTVFGMVFGCNVVLVFGVVFG